MRWAVVVPVKRLDRAKSRLGDPVRPSRAELALAMALDTVAAALGCPDVDAVLAVCDDQTAISGLRELGAVVVADEPAAGLNPALAHGADVARQRLPTGAVAALSADLPALDPPTLGRALNAAAEYARAFVADAAGTGTTLLTARPGQALVPAYGGNSRQRHRAAGAVELDATGLDRLRRDVDTMADLWAAAELGVGARTAALLSALDRG